MQLWLSRHSNVPIPEQLATQVILAILSDDLAPGQRLPSTRELARRFKVHANTISSGFKRLEQEGWVELRHGSGVFVRQSRPELPQSSILKVDQMITSLFSSARQLGVPLPDVRSRLRHWLEMQPPDHFVLIEPDEELARIVVSELQSSLQLPIRISTEMDRELLRSQLQNAAPVVLPRKEAAVRKLLSPSADLIVLQIRSVSTSLNQWLPAPSDRIVAVVSRWGEFLKLARTMLLAAGFHGDTILLRDARTRSWQRGLAEAVAVVCDSLIVRDLQGLPRVIPFPLISENSIAELQRYESFIRAPLGK